MFRNKPNDERWEALLDGELSIDQQQQIEESFDSSTLFQSQIRRDQEELNLFQHHLKREIQQVEQKINFDDFYTQLEAKLQSNTAAPVIKKKQTLASNTAENSLFAKFIDWMQARPTVPFALASGFAVLVILALPLLDPGPDRNDCVVDQVTNSKTSQVAVLQSKNEATGHKITVIVVNEPPVELQQEQTAPIPTKKTKKDIP